MLIDLTFVKRKIEYNAFLIGKNPYLCLNILPMSKQVEITDFCA